MDTDMNAAELGARGGRKGGKARAANMSEEERATAASTAAVKRWHGIDVDKLPVAKYGSTDRPLLIGDVKIDCYVLEDGTRVITHSAMLQALGIDPRSGSTGGSHRLANFAMGKRLEPFIGANLLSRTQRPKWFRLPRNNAPAHGYEATILADICDAVLAARAAGALHPQQAGVAEACEILMRGFAKVGIIALVDEATGYQEHRTGDELRKLLNRYILEEFRPWTKTFPDDYFREIYRLHAWSYEEGNHGHPQYVGKLINKTIYDAMAPGMKEELRRVNPTNEKGRRSRTHVQHLTEDVGLVHLRQQISTVTTLMRASRTKEEFADLFGRAFPPTGPIIDLISEQA